MRRFFVGVALYTLAAVTPLAAWGGDREIAEEIYSKLKGQQAAGVLQGFTLDMDVSNGRVLLKGRVSSEEQRRAVLDSANSTEGVTEVVDEIAVGKSVQEAVSPSRPKPVTLDGVSKPVAKPKVPTFSLSKALAEQAPATALASGTAHGSVVPAGATESAASLSDEQIKSAVIQSLGDAQRQGTLRGFGLEVRSTDGDVLLRGRARSGEVKQTIMEMVRRVPGVRNVIDDIQVEPAGHPASQGMDDQAQQVRHLQPVDVQTVSTASPLAARGPVAPAAPVQFHGPQAGMPMAHMAAAPNGDAVVAGVAAPGAVAYGAVAAPATPVPVGYGAPHYDSPYLPNYAWPGYAAYPNYAALTYPQQYSPTAWPYIGPFYPYPQVPLGWRKVSLEWDDGWWYLDFTDK